MSRLLIFPQWPSKLRYPEWWSDQLRRGFSKHFNVVNISGESVSEDYSARDFSSLKSSIIWEAGQLKEAVNVIQDGDILFFADISYPGFVPQLVFHYKDNKKFGFCHATAKNFGDVFEYERNAKYMQEKAVMSHLDGVFFGTEYSRNKHYAHNAKNAHVVGLPGIPFRRNWRFGQDIKYDVGIVSRVTPQKVNMKSMKVLEDSGLSIGFNDHTKSKSWQEYFKWIESCGVIVSLAREETFGYVVMDCSLVGTPFIVPNLFGYREVVRPELRYNSDEEMLAIINKYKNNGIVSMTDWAVETSKGWFNNVSRIISE